MLSHWHDVLLLLGTAAATLMGLTFVAVTLAPEIIAGRESTAVRAFVTPIVAFFATVLVIAIVLLIPGITPTALAVIFALAGITGLAYHLTTTAHRQWREFELGVDDWIWYVGLPLAAYGAVFASAFGWWRVTAWAPYVLIAAIVVLLVVGIRNAWDIVLTMARHRNPQ